MMMAKQKLFDVIIIGGSYAGLSTAMALGRSLREVLVIDNGSPCNRQTPHSHNFLTQDGGTPREISAVAKEQVAKYDTVRFIEGLAIKGKKTEKGFLIETEADEKFQAKKLVFATGITDVMPNIKGFSACWGISVIHCPYCHGYEFRGEKTGLLANGDRAAHLSGLVHNLTKDLILFTHGEPQLTDKQLDKLAKNNVPVIEPEIMEIKHQNGYMERIALKNGEELPLSALYAAIPFVQHSDIPASLGCELTDAGYIKVDDSRKTSVPGVYACGDNSSPMRSVANAVFTGNMTGAMVNAELTNE